MGNLVAITPAQLNEDMNITPNINKWLATGRRGISSEAIVSHLTGINIVGDWGMRPPSDTSDLERCFKLIEAAPEIRTELSRMGEVCPVWKSLVENWDELLGMFSRPKTDSYDPWDAVYKRMKELGC